MNTPLRTDMRVCVQCGSTVHAQFGHTWPEGFVCRECKPSPARDPATTSWVTPQPVASSSVVAQENAGVGVFICAVLGVLFMGIGGWHLLNPGVAVDGLGTLGVNEVVNMQRLAIGQTCTIAGAIFLAAALRPRR